MTSATAGSGMKWVGRAIRRLEDPALVTGRGRFTADLAASHHLRFVRSAVASGRIVRIAAPDDANILTATELDGARPIRPMLHKFDYRPIEQPLLAKDVVRFVGEPVAAVYAASAAEAEDIADRVDIEIEELPAVIDARDCARARCAARARARQCRGRRQYQDRGFRRHARQGAPPHSAQFALAPAKRDAARSARRACGVRSGNAAAPRSPAPRRCRISPAPPSPIFSALPNPICA